MTVCRTTTASMTTTRTRRTGRLRRRRRRLRQPPGRLQPGSDQHGRGRQGDAATTMRRLPARTCSSGRSPNARLTRTATTWRMASCLPGTGAHREQSELILVMADNCPGVRNGHLRRGGTLLRQQRRRRRVGRRGRARLAV